LSVLRSANEWPRRDGNYGLGEVGDLNLAAAAAADNEVVNGLSWGGTGGERRRIIWTWTYSSM